MNEEREPVTHDVQLEGRLSLTDSVSWEIRRKPVIERDRRLIILLVVLILGGPAIGLVLPGIPGFAVGIGVGIISTLVGLRALTKVVRIERG
jgi:hypothetical protein